MARFKIQAGGTIDVATRDEVRQEIEAASASWLTEVARGDRFVRFSMEQDPTGGGLLLGEYSNEHIGPRAGFVWSLKRLAITGYDPAAADSLRLYAGGVNDSAVIIPKLSTFHTFDGNNVVMYPGDRLVIAGTVAGAARVWVTGQARELPLSLAWRL